MHKVPILTLGNIRKAGPCGVGDKAIGFGLLLTNLGQPMVRYKKNFELTLGDVAASNGAEDAWWCVQALDCEDIATRRAVVSVILKSCHRAAERTKDKDKRVRECLDALDRWCGGDDTIDLAAARDTAQAAVRAAAWAAARAATWAATWAAASDAARDTAQAAVRAAAWAAASDAARDTASDAARDTAQAAVRAAAWAAARAAELSLQRAELIAAFPPMHIK